MNIREAKQEIKNAMTAYFTKDELGRYVIPPEEQRPVFLMGPPGIGKTAIMKQIAQELGVGLLSYSMTHHTRQSALGLPFIVDKEYGGKNFSITEYTMSEIIASVYDLMEESGVKEGILFLDEINCVSETLSPVMLQFLQYKVFGRHRVPDGWIVVTAGNPPEYNDSVREFDMVTWDRLKRIDVEPDFDVWKEYALDKAVHPAIVTYLDIRKGNFYAIKASAGGRRFVTARGWADLSTMLRLYERNGLEVCERMISQYLQDPHIAKEFSVYYDLFNKYKSDYQIDKILAGKAPAEIVERAKAAKFDERLAIIALLLDSLGAELADIYEQAKLAEGMLGALSRVRNAIAHGKTTAADALEEEVRAERERVDSLVAASGRLDKAERLSQLIIQNLQRQVGLVAMEEDAQVAFKALKKDYDTMKKAPAAKVKETGRHLSNAFKFCEEAFGEGQEILVFVTELTANSNAAQFIARYGCDEYFKHNKELLFYERHIELASEIENLDL